MEEIEKLIETAGTLKELVKVQQEQLEYIQKVMPGAFSMLVFNEDYMKLKLMSDTLKYKLEL